MDDSKAKKQAAFWHSMLDKYHERNDRLEEQQCHLEHRLEAMQVAVPAALMCKMNKNAIVNQRDITKFISQLGNSKMMMASESSIVSCPCSLCMANNSSFQSAGNSGLSSNSCSCNSCMGGQTPQPNTRISNDNCSCNPCPSTPDPSRYSSASRNLGASQQSVATGPDSSCTCMDTGTATPTPPTSLCTCNPCLANSTYSAESSMLEKISAFSLQSADLLYMKKLHELAIKEKQMKHQLQEMEHREQAYLETLRQADNMWACMEGCYKQRLSDVQQSGDSTCLKYEKMNQQLMEENTRLSDELKDLRLELKQCIEQVQGPITRQLEKERRKSVQLEEDLVCASTCMAHKECAYIKDMCNLQNQLNDTCKNLCSLNAMNDELKKELCKLKRKYTELEQDLICQKISEAHTLQRLQEALDAEQDRKPKCDCSAGPDSGPRPEPGAGPGAGLGAGPGARPGAGPAAGSRPDDNSLNGIARRLSKTLFDVDQCNQCTQLPTNLTDTVRGIKDIVDIVDKGGKLKIQKKEPSEEKPKSGEPPPKEPKPEESGESDQTSLAEQAITTIQLDIAVHEDGVDIEAETEVVMEAPSQTPSEKLSHEVAIQEGSVDIEASLSLKSSQTPSAKLSREPSGQLSKKSSGTVTKDASEKISQELSRKSSFKPCEGVCSKLGGKSKEPSEKISQELSPKESRKSSVEFCEGVRPTPSGKISKDSSKRSSTRSLSKEHSRTKSSRVSIQECGDIVASAEASLDETALNESCALQPEIEITTEVEVAGNVEIDVDTEVNLYDAISDEVNITTTITGSGMLEVITEGPAGIIETTMTYTESGNIEVTTEITEYPVEGYQPDGSRLSAEAIEEIMQKSDLEISVSSTSHTTASSTSHLIPSSPSRVTIESSFESQQPSGVSKISETKIYEESDAENWASKKTSTEVEASAKSKDGAVEKTITDKAIEIEAEKVTSEVAVSVTVEIGIQPEAVDKSEVGVEAEIVVEITDKETGTVEESKTSVETAALLSVEAKTGDEVKVFLKEEASIEAEALGEEKLFAKTPVESVMGKEVEPSAETKALTEAEGLAEREEIKLFVEAEALTEEKETKALTEAEAPTEEEETKSLTIAEALAEGEEVQPFAEAKASTEGEKIEPFSEAEGFAESEIFVEAETLTPVESKAGEEIKPFAEAEPPTAAEVSGETEEFVEAEAPAAVEIKPSEAEAPTETEVLATEETFLEAEASPTTPVEAKTGEEMEVFAEPEAFAEDEIFVDSEAPSKSKTPSTAESEVYVEAKASEAPAELEVMIEISQAEPEIITIKARIDIEEEEEEENGKVKPLKHESISEEPYIVEEDTEDLRKGVEEALNKANKDVMDALEQANKNVAEALAKANKDVESALALAVKETQSRANKQVATEILDLDPKTVTSATIEPEVYEEPIAKEQLVSEKASLTKESFVSAVSIGEETLTDEVSPVSRKQVKGSQGLLVAGAATLPTDTTVKDGWDAVYGDEMPGMPRVRSVEKCKGVCSPSYTKEKEEVCTDECARAFKTQIAIKTQVSALEAPDAAIETQASALKASASAIVAPTSAHEARATASEAPTSPLEVKEYAPESLASTQETLISATEASAVEVSKSAVEVPALATGASEVATTALTSAAEAPKSTLEALASTFEAPESATTEPMSEIEDSKTALKAPKSVFESPGSPIEAAEWALGSPESAIKAPESTLEAPKTALKASVTELPVSTIEASESALKAPAMKIEASALEASESTPKIPASTLKAPESEAEVSALEVAGFASKEAASALETSEFGFETPALTSKALVSELDAQAFTLEVPTLADEPTARREEATFSAVLPDAVPSSVTPSSVTLPETGVELEIVIEQEAVVGAGDITITISEPSEGPATTSERKLSSFTEEPLIESTRSESVATTRSVVKQSSQESGKSKDLAEKAVTEEEAEQESRALLERGTEDDDQGVKRLSQRASKTEDQRGAESKGSSRRSSGKGSLKSPQTRSKQLETVETPERTSIVATRSTRTSQSDRRCSLEQKTKTSISRESLSRIPVPLQRRSKLADIKCGCRECECEICSPDMVKKREEKLKAARLAQGQPDDCTCKPNCTCARCAAPDKTKIHSAEEIEGGSKRQSFAEIPGSTRQSEDLQVYKGSRRQSSARASMECCDPRAEHPPDCDCLECFCEPCGSFPDKVRTHPPDCDCLSCLCDPCGDECESARSGPTSKDASREIFKEKSLTESLKACREESTRKLLQSREQSKRRLESLAEHPPDCDCVICRCCYNCTEKKTETHKFPPENCKCDQCLCLEGIPSTVRRKSLTAEPPNNIDKLDKVAAEEAKQEAKVTKHTFPLEDCTCDECLCLDGIPPTALVRDGLASDSLKLDEVPVSDESPSDSLKLEEVPVINEPPSGSLKLSEDLISDKIPSDSLTLDEIPKIDEPPADGPKLDDVPVTAEPECAHRPDCDCLDCILVCDISCPDSQKQPNESKITAETDILETDDTTIEVRIEEMEKESLERKSEMKELQNIIQQIQCACYEAEVRATQKSPAEQKFACKQKASYQNTISNMQVALSALQDKCKQKDRMIATMIKELQLRANSKIFDDMLHKLATAGSSEIIADFDRTEICGSLPRPICDLKYGKPSNQLKEPLPCQPCTHPDYPNCPCKSGDVNSTTKERLPVCSHPNFPNCPCTTGYSKPSPAKPSVQSVEIKPCNHPNYPDCPCATNHTVPAISESHICTHANYPNCPCKVSVNPVVKEKPPVCSHPNFPNCPCTTKHSKPAVQSVEIKSCNHPNYPDCPCATEQTTKSSALEQEERICNHPNYPNCPCATRNKPPTVTPQHQAVLLPSTRAAPKDNAKKKPILLPCPQPDGSCPCKLQKTAGEDKTTNVVVKPKKPTKSCLCTGRSSRKKVTVQKSSDEGSTSDSKTTSTSERNSSSKRSSSSSRISSSTSARKSSSGRSSSASNRKETSRSDQTTSSGSEQRRSSKRKRSANVHKKSCPCSSRQPDTVQKSTSRSQHKSPSASPKSSKHSPVQLKKPPDCSTPAASEAYISRSARLRKLSTTPPVAPASCVCDTDRPDGPLNKPSTKEIIDSSPMEVTEIRRITPDSLLIKWSAPRSKYVTGYEILVDGIIKSRVHSAKRTSAILHTLALKSSVHVSIFAITNVGRCQPPANAIFQI